MPEHQPASGAAITLDQLIALNDEIVALVRVGVPLEQGLRHLGGDLPGQLGKLTTMLSERMERGQSLAAVLEEHPESFPPVYRAVVQAGLKTGRLSAALESVAGAARRLAEIRQMLIAAFLYPLLVFLVAWGFFLFFVWKIAPILLPSFEDFDAPAQPLMALLVQLGDSIQYWGPAVPLAVVALVGYWWFRSARAGLMQARSADLLLGWLPWMGSLIRSFRTAAFADVLALLVEHEVPLHEGIVLAAEAAGDRRMLRDARRIAAQIERGDSLRRSTDRGTGFPPLVDWLIRSGHQRGALLSALRHASDIYHRRAFRQATAARTLMPTFLMIAIGGSITLAYGLLLFGPWVSLLYRLGEL